MKQLILILALAASAAFGQLRPRELVVTPTPTCVVTYLSGHIGQPANPIFFNTYPEALELLAELRSKGVVPFSAKVVDVSYAAGPLVPCGDGRWVWGIQWIEVVSEADGSQHQALREVFAGLLYWRWKELPLGLWRNLGDGNIGRW